MKAVTMVRIYLTEGEQKLQPLLTYLHDEHRVRGVTVMRGISGFGQSGKFHTVHLVDLTMDLPIVIEFFDTPEKVHPLLTSLHSFIEPGHLVYWSAYVNEA